MNDNDNREKILKIKKKCIYHSVEILQTLLDLKLIEDENSLKILYEVLDLSRKILDLLKNDLNRVNTKEKISSYIEEVSLIESKINREKEKIKIKIEDEINKIKNISLNYKNLLSESDKKIIDFLIRRKLEKKNSEDLCNKICNKIKIIYFYTRHLSKTCLLKNIYKKIVKNLEPNSENLFYIKKCIFLDSYELILYLVDNTLYEILIDEEGLKECKDIDNFLKIDRENSDEHSTANEISAVLKKLLLEEYRENKDEINKVVDNSIFGKNSEIRKFRNKIAHSNLRYDANRNEIIIGDERYRIEKLDELYMKLGFFIDYWIKKWKEEFSKIHKEDFLKISNLLNEIIIILKETLLFIN